MMENRTLASYESGNCSQVLAKDIVKQLILEYKQLVFDIIIKYNLEKMQYYSVKLTFIIVTKKCDCGW